MASRPSFQWYPGDWRRDTALQSTSLAVRGLWAEMLNIMHDGEPYGHLTAGGVAITPEELARMVGGTLRDVNAGLAALEARKVFSRTPEGVIYSRRMVRDEAIRQVRAAGGKGAHQPHAKGGGKGMPKGGGKGAKTIPLGAPFDPPPAVFSLLSALPPDPQGGEDEPTDPVADAASWLVESYPRWYAEERHGATYRSQPNLDFQAALGVMETWTDRAHVERMCRTFLRATNLVSAHANRALDTFAAKYASACDAQVRAGGAA